MLKKLLRPIATGANSAMDQSEFVTNACNLLKAREKHRRARWDWFGFRFLFLEKRGNHKSIITFDSYLKTVLKSEKKKPKPKLYCQTTVSLKIVFVHIQFTQSCASQLHLMFLPVHSGPQNTSDGLHVA